MVYLLYFTMFVEGMSYSDAMLVLTLGGLPSSRYLSSTYRSFQFKPAPTRTKQNSRENKIVTSSLKPSIAYPLNKKFRMGMTVMMFALVIFVIVLQSIISVTYRPDMAKEGGEDMTFVDFQLHH